MKCHALRTLILQVSRKIFLELILLGLPSLALSKYSVCYHHGGMETEDRTLVEKLFLEGEISVICCTSTLAVGVNLPAYLVILKVCYQLGPISIGPTDLKTVEYCRMDGEQSERIF